jgi:hypothetical protein
VKLNKNKTMITRKEYMSSSSDLHHAYYSQFVTESTKQFVLSSLSVDQIRKAIDSGDKHLNEIKIPYNNMSHGGGWWWDGSPVNMNLMLEAGELSPRCLPSQATHTCVGKAAAKMLIEEQKGGEA